MQLNQQFQAAAILIVLVTGGLTVAETSRGNQISDSADVPAGDFRSPPRLGEVAVLTAGPDFETAPGAKFDWAWMCSGGATVPVTVSVHIDVSTSGHSHQNAGQPLGTWSNGSPRLLCDNQWHLVSTYLAPNIAGLAYVTFTRPGFASTRTLKIGINGLQQLPASPYITTVNFDAFSNLLRIAPPHDHPDNHWGKPLLVADTLDLAKKYFFRRNKKIIVNDMSLPWGGVLDFKDNWGPPHETHQDGRHVDIQMKGAMTLDDQVAFRSIAESIFGKGHVCIDGGTHWHLVIETTCTNSRLQVFGFKRSDLK